MNKDAENSCISLCANVTYLGRSRTLATSISVSFNKPNLVIFGAAFSNSSYRKENIISYGIVSAGRNLCLKFAFKLTTLNKTNTNGTNKNGLGIDRNTY